MTFQTGVTEFAEFLGTEIKRIEKKILDGGSNQSSSQIVITGNGRPDNPNTTGGKITGVEPNGAIYTSINGAGVGAYQWQKCGGRWKIVYGDTGDITMNSQNTVVGNWVRIKRYNNLVIMSFGGGPWGWFQVLGKGSKDFIQRKRNTRNIDLIKLGGIPQGFRTDFSFLKPFYNDIGIEIGKLYIGGKGDSNYIEMRFLEDIRETDYQDLRFPDVMWYTTDDFPASL